MRRRINGVAFAIAIAVAMTACSSPTTPQHRVFIDPGLAPLVPADTNVLAGVRMDRLSKHPAFPLVTNLGSVQRFVEITGVKPNDLWQVLFVSNGRDSFLLGRGKFANELMAPNVERYGRAGGRFDYQGLSMVGSEDSALMFFNSTTTAIGPAPVLRALVDARGQMRDVPARFEPLLAEIPLESEIWGAYAGGPVNIDFPGNLANLRNVFALLQSGMFYANANTGFHLVASGTSPSASAAQKLHDALQGLMAIGGIRGDVSLDGARVKLTADVGL